MKRGIIPLITAGLLAGVGSAQAQVVEYLRADDYSGANHAFFAAFPSYWTGEDSTPTSNYDPSGPTFSIAGLAANGTFGQKKVHKNGNIQLQSTDDFEEMLAFDIAPTNLGIIRINSSTYGTVVGDKTYVLVHHSSEASTDGWYAAEVRDETGNTALDLTVNIEDLTWHAFTPGATNGAPLGTIGAAVSLSTVTNSLIDEVGFYADVDCNGTDAGNYGLNDFVAYAYVPEDPFFPATLELNPTALEGSFADATDIITNSFSVSYIEGNPATNVNVSSVSIINDTTFGGFSAAPASFVLNAPAPSNQLVDVIYDNNLGGLLENGVGSADVQILWNEIGSAVVYTSTLPVSVAYQAVNDNNIIALFDQNFTTADRFLYGMDTAVLSDLDQITGYGSTDTSYGTKFGNAPIVGGAHPASVNDPNIVIAITNNTGFAATLDSLHFDVGRRWLAGPGRVDVAITGDVTPTNINNITGFDIPDTISDQYLNMDIPLGGETLADGDSVHITFSFSQPGNNNNADAIAVIDNVALLGSGTAAVIPATVTRVSPFPWESLGVSGYDLSVSQSIDLMYTVGELNTNVTITGVSFADEDDPGAWSAVGDFPVLLPTPEVTNSAVFELVFDNAIADVQAGTNSYAQVIVEISEPGYGAHTMSFSAYATRPATAGEGVIALFHTEFMTPDEAHEGVMGRWAEGESFTDINGSVDGTYGTLTPPAAPTDDNTSWRMSLTNNVSTLLVENNGTASIELSMFHFDIGRWYLGATNFTVSITGDLSATNIVKTLGTLGWQNDDYEDHDIDLTGLPDHTLGSGESATFTFTLGENDEVSQFNGHWIDNVALMGTAGDIYAGWADSYGLIPGVNDGPNDNPDGDSKDNFMEYATGGDPLVADGSAATMWMEGTNWLYHVHQERKDDDSLNYGVGTKGSLVIDPSWDVLDVEEVGATSGPGLWKSVTNRTEMVGDTKFLGLEVQQN